MAEHVPFGIVGSLINNLASLALGEFGRVYGLSAELDKLKTTLENIRSVLSDAEVRQDLDRAVMIWIRRLKEVVHDADNLFDELVVEDLRRKVNNNHGQVRDFFSSKNQLVFRRKMARKIEKIRKELDYVSVDMFKLNLMQRMVVSERNESDWRETSSFDLSLEIFGREYDKTCVIKLLMHTQTDRNVSFLSIVSIGGAGKTTLAQLVYNDAQVQNHFEIMMWVCVSEEFDLKAILNNMLNSLQGKEVGDLILDELQWKLEKELNGRRFMLVLDDVWNENVQDWDLLRRCLTCGGEGSKILLTTRSEKVASITATISPYHLTTMSGDDSWALFKSIAFGKNTGGMSPILEAIGKEIVRKCRGLPLAIRALGCHLRDKNEESEWLRILRSELWDVPQESHAILPALKIAYQNLAPELRQCFAYCSLYPKDWMFEKDELIQLWMAQGYLESSNGAQSMEAVGNGCVETLLMSSFFKDPSVNTSSGKLCFTMHDLMHDLALSVAGNDYHLEGEGRRLEGRTMHLSFVSCRTRSVRSLETLDASKLRTVLGPKTKYQFVAIPSIIKDLKYVRALDLSCSSITMLPKSIGKLKHLRYLDLSFCKELISLPESIGNLVCLQTLKLRWCKKLVSGVEGITKLINLRLLDIECCKAFDDMMPAGLGKLTLLQSLLKFVVGDDNSSKSGKLNELKDLNNIRGDLRITNLGLVKDVASESQEVNLKAKKYIQLLELYWGNDGYDWEMKNKDNESLLLLDNLCPHQNLEKLTVDAYPGLQFSSWLCSLINIVEINLLHFSDCQHLPPLERLPCLKTLQIRNMKELRFMYYEEMSDLFFPSLERLVFYDCRNLRGWQRLGDVNNTNDIHNHLSLPPFPHLSSLRLWNCPKLTCMPTFPSVVKLELGLCSVKPMIETCLVQHQSPSFYPLSSLKYLDIGEEMDIGAMPMEWMQNLTSLEHLSVSGSPFIAAVLQNLRQA